jgi:hypothetical protein
MWASQCGPSNETFPTPPLYLRSLRRQGDPYEPIQVTSLSDETAFDDS